MLHRILKFGAIPGVVTIILYGLFRSLVPDFILENKALNGLLIFCAFIILVALSYKLFDKKG